MFILLRAKRIKRFGYRDRRVFQIVFISGPYRRTACLIFRRKDNMKVNPNSIVLGSLASKVLRPGEQKSYVTGGIIRIEREREGGGGKIGSLILEITKKIKGKINSNIILSIGDTRLYRFLSRIHFKYVKISASQVWLGS
jgi:hypothetical protein